MARGHLGSDSTARFERLRHQQVSLGLGKRQFGVGSLWRQKDVVTLSCRKRAALANVGTAIER